jgi:hypothetical protein
MDAALSLVEKVNASLLAQAGSTGAAAGLAGTLLQFWLTVLAEGSVGG